MLPTSHVWSATIQVLATATLAKVKHVLPEKTSAISWAEPSTSAARTHNSPSISSIGTMVPEEHSSMPALFKHFKSHQMPPSAHVPSGHSTAPSVQAIIVDGVSIVNPKLAPIIRNELEVVTA
jgi:hypothetical protein